MWASGTTADGSSSVPARTNITSGRVYSLNTATWRETDLRTYGRGVPPLYAVPYERRIAAPLLVVGSKGDPLVDEADVDRLLARAWSSEKRAVLVDDAGHGWSFLQGSGANAAIRDAVANFLADAGTPVATGCA